MPITNEDITYTLSGGNTNSNPLLSLGGERSFFSVVGTSVFSDVLKPLVDANSCASCYFELRQRGLMG